MLSPESEGELADMIAGATGPLRVSGGGTRGFGADVEGDGLSAAGLRGVSLYEPGALTIVVGAGTPVAKVEATLAAEKQRLPFEPMDHRVLMGTDGEPTIGGVVAANVSGPRRVQAGACRDSLIGVRFVDGRGDVIKNGGRVMKNVTGYDLVKLMAGSFGTLGVLSEVAFKVLPQADAVGSLVLRGLSEAEAIEAMSAALGSPYEVTGAAHHGGTSETLVRLEGFASSVEYRTEALGRHLASFGTWEVHRDPEDEARRWREVRDVTTFADSPGDVWRVSVKPTDAPALLAKVPAEDALFDWGGGLIWLRVAEGTDLRSALGMFHGHATLIRASAETKARLGVFHPEPAPLAAISRDLRKKFDPRRILNPGLMG